MLLLELLHDADRALRINHQRATFNQIVKLAFARVIKGQHKRRFASRNSNIARHQILQRNRIIVIIVEHLQVFPEVLRRPPPVGFRITDQMVFQNHDAAKLVRGEAAFWGAQGSQLGRGRALFRSIPADCEKCNTKNNHHNK